MEKKVKFHDYQEQQAQDHNDIQTYTRASFDHIVHDVVTKSRRFTGFNVIKSGQVELQIAPGRVYDVDGAVYIREATLVQSVIPNLASVAKRYVLISALPQEVETDNEVRDILVDVDTGRIEPQSVATSTVRQAVLQFTNGTESGDPQPPATPVGHVAIALILLDATQVVSVTMQTQNLVSSTEDLDLRADLLEAFKAAIEPRVSALASDLAALSARLDQIANRATSSNLSMLYQDIADLKDLLNVPSQGSDYGADHFLNLDDTDVNNASQLGIDCIVAEGIRFAHANQSLATIKLFSNFDPNASLSSAGFLLPRYTDVLKLQNGAYASDLPMSQYGYQTLEMRVGSISRYRLRYGGGYTRCTNGAWYDTRQGDSPLSNLYGTQSFSMTDTNGSTVRFDSYWFDEYREPFNYSIAVDHTINGAMVAQSFLVANDTWATKLGFYLTVNAGAAITVALVNVTNGVPNPEQTMAFITIPGENLRVGWNEVVIPPTFMKRGQRCALTLVSPGAHRLGMTSGQNFLDGTFFYSTDNAFYQGDLTKDMMFRVYGAQFENAQVVIEFEALSLGGGVRNIDVKWSGHIPASTQLIFEVQPQGGEWKPLSRDVLDILQSAQAPTLLRFRARFVGSRDIMPGIWLNNDTTVSLSTPKLTFKHVTEEQVLGTPSDDIYVKMRLERFFETPHDFNCKLWNGSAELTATTTTEVEVDEDLGIVERTYHFHLGANITNFRITCTGATNSNMSVYHVAERIHWAQ